MNYWYRAIGRGIDEEVLSEIVRFMYGSLITVAIAGTTFSLAAFLCYQRTGDTTIEWIFALGVIASIGRILVYLVDHRPTKADIRRRMEKRQLRYASMAIIYSCLIGLLCARAVMLGDYLAIGISCAVMAPYTTGLLAYVSVRPLFALIQSTLPPAIMAPVALLSPDGYIKWFGVLALMLILNNVRVNSQQGRMLLEVFEGRQRERQFARHDALTGLLNRRGLDDAIDGLESGTIATLVIDLDGFKPINDIYGHHAGDELLRMVAARLRESLASNDVAARSGGDEFVIILHEERAAEYQVITSTLEDAIGQPYRLGDAVVRIGASIGVAIANCGNETAADLLRRADTVMYDRKLCRRQGAPRGAQLSIAC